MKTGHGRQRLLTLKFFGRKTVIIIKKEGIILQKTDLPFEDKAVLNPAVLRQGNSVLLFYRAVSKAHISTIGFCRLDGPLQVAERMDHPVLMPSLPAEKEGVEDPRIVKIDGVYYLSYIAFDGVNAMGALAVSDDLINFRKLGLIVPRYTFPDFKKFAENSGLLNDKYARYAHDKTLRIKDKPAFVWDKDLVFFPRRINNKLYFLHRIKPDIQITAVNELDDLTPEFWTNYLLHFADYIVMTPEFDHEISYIGAGCPPVETEHGWLVIYHGVHDTKNGYVYSACAALLNLDDPNKEIARLPYPLFKPDSPWEVNGEVNNVCFPSGTALFGEQLYIYYGAADEQIACASVNMTALLKELLLFAKKPPAQSDGKSSDQ